MTTPLQNNENPITDRKNNKSRESITPRWKPEKCGITLKLEIKPTSFGAKLITNRVTGSHPQRMRKKQITTDKMKLMTWFRVSADVRHVTAR